MKWRTGMCPTHSITCWTNGPVSHSLDKMQSAWAGPLTRQLIYRMGLYLIHSTVYRLSGPGPYARHFVEWMNRIERMAQNMAKVRRFALTCSCVNWSSAKNIFHRSKRWMLSLGRGLYRASRSEQGWLLMKLALTTREWKHERVWLKMEVWLHPYGAACFLFMANQIARFIPGATKSWVLTFSKVMWIIVLQEHKNAARSGYNQITTLTTSITSQQTKTFIT